MARARQAWAKHEVTELLDDVDSRISSRVLRAALFSAAREIVGEDEQTENEQQLLTEIAVRFD
jgi:hypothetical protein